MSVNLFDVNFYRQANPDLATAGLTTNEQLTNHFFTSGLDEVNVGFRSFSPVVDLNFYRASNPDLVNAGITSNRALYDHLANSGVGDGFRAFSPFFSISTYSAFNPDLNTYATNVLQLPATGPGRNEFYFNHFVNNGVNESLRRFSQFVDLSVYQAANQDLRVAVPTSKGLLDHLAIYGIDEGRRFSLSYDTNFYRASNPDLAGANITTPRQLLQHFEIYGLDNLNRPSSDMFNATAYLANNTDLQRAGFNQRTAQQHFERVGYMEPFRKPGSSPFSQFTSTGDTIATSSNIGAVSSQRPGTVTASLNAQNTGDMYKFLVPFTQTVNFTVNGYTGNLTPQLIYDANGNGVYNPGLNTGESIGPFGLPNNPSQIVFNRTLGAGTYYLLLRGGSGFNSSYNFSLSATNFDLVPNLDVGNTLGTAFNISPVSNNIQTVTQFVGSTDPEDIYRFNVTTSSNVKFNLAGLTGLGADRVNLQLVRDTNNNGQIEPSDIITSVLSSGTTAALNQNLGAGTYFVRVARAQVNGNTGYSLSFNT